MGPPPGIPTTTQGLYAMPTFLETLDSCSQWTAVADDFVTAAEEATAVIAQGDGILAMPGLSWRKRRRLKRDRDETSARLNNVYSQHSNLLVQLHNLTASIETATTAQTAEEARLAMIGPPTLPAVRSSLILGYDEIARFEGVATLEKYGKRQTELSSGSLVLTDRRILFESHNGISETPIANIMRVTYSISWPSHPFVTLTGKGSNQKYFARDAVRIAVIVEMLVRMQNRHVIATSPEASRSIPQQVKIAVWQRDRGRCVQCGSDQYLEYDHVIPWSKGGASSMENLQLLCRRCNALKGDRL